jgi:menaquinone-dependent protoporphyrinogen IX oxidase
MSTLAILYATREGHTHKIAEHLAQRLVSRGHATQIVDVRSPREPFDLGRFDFAEELQSRRRAEASHVAARR